MKIKMYVLCLLKFTDDKIVFNGAELKSIKTAIAKGLKQQKIFKGYRKTSAVFKVYQLNPKKVKTWVGKSATIKSAEIGFYHHRVIVYLKLDSVDDFSKLREVRDKLKEPIYNMIKCGVKDQIYELISLRQVRPKAKVEFCYTYPLTVVEKRPKGSEAFPFSEETSSLCFDIVEPSWCKPPWGKKHMMRISIPGAVLYPSKWGVGTGLLRDIINAIYQYCLYERKLIDAREQRHENRLDEKLLTSLWTQIVDRMGGRTIDVHIIKLTHLAYFLALAALILSIISLSVSC